MAKVNDFSQLSLEFAKQNELTRQAVQEQGNRTVGSFDLLTNTQNISRKFQTAILGKLLPFGLGKILTGENRKKAKEQKKADKDLAKALGMNFKDLKLFQQKANLKEQKQNQLKNLLGAVDKLELTAADIGKNNDLALLMDEFHVANKEVEEKDKDGTQEQSGAKASEDATELRILNDSMLSEQEKQTALLQLLVDASSDAERAEERSSGGLFSSIAKMGKGFLTAIGTIGASFLALPLFKKLTKFFMPKVVTPPTTPRPVATGPLKKDGTPDKRFKANKVVTPPVKPPVKAGSTLKNMAKLGLKGAKFLPVVGLAVTAISGLWDGFTAGMKEAENENSTGLTIAREATAGVLSGLTFGLIDQETISSKMTGIADGITGVASSVKNKITDIAASATEKFTEAKDSAIALGLSVKNKMVDIGVSASEKFNEAKESAIALGLSVKNKITDIGASASEKFTEAKDSAIALGLSVKDKITSIPIPTFAEASESLYNFSTGFASAIGIPVPTFDDAKASLTAMGTSLTAGFTSLFGDEDGSFSFESVSKGVTGLAGGYFQKITDIWNSITDIFPSWEEIKKMLPSPKKILSMLTFGLLDDDEKFDAGDYISRSEVKSLVASAVTKALQEQSMMNSTAAANAPFMFMQGANQTTTSVNNITKPIMIPTPPSNPNDSWWNVSNLF